MPSTSRGREVARRNLVDIKGRRVGSEDRISLRHPVEIGEHPLLELHLLEYRFNHEIGRTYRVELRDPFDQSDAALHLVSAEPAARHRRAVVGGDPVEALLQQVAPSLDNRDRDPGIGKTHRDAAAHRAGADNRAARDRARLCSLWYSGYSSRLALGEEDVALGL